MCVKTAHYLVGTLFESPFIYNFFIMRLQTINEHIYKGNLMVNCYQKTIIIVVP